MANRIKDVHVVNYRLDPHETELRIHVELDEVTPTTQIKGRLMGPRNVYASTVEVAYPMREVERGPGIVMRVVIPEPSWWEPRTPFLYQGPLELWQEGQLCERRQISHGISRLQLTAKGLHLNGKPIILLGRTIDSGITDAEAKALHNQGICLAMTSWDERLADLADRCGLFLLVHTFDFPGNAFLKHPSAFGWSEEWGGIFNLAETINGQKERKGTFWLCPLDKLPEPEARPGGKIVLADQLPNPLPVRPDVIGWIESR